MFDGKTVLVTGGAGFIGSHLVDACLKMGAKKVISFDNLAGVHPGRDNHSHLKDEPRFEFVRGDIRNFEEISVEVAKADVIFSEAAAKLVHGLKNPLVEIQTNALGNANILEAMRRYAPEAVLVFASTGSVYGTGDDTFFETSPKKPITVYGRSKLAAENYIEHYVKSYGLKAGILRYFSVFGPRQDYHSEGGVISRFISSVLKGESPDVFGTGAQTRHFTPIDHVIRANFLVYEALEKGDGLGEAYNIAYPQETSVKELAETIIERYSKKEGVEMRFVEAREGDAMKINPSTEKVEKLGLEKKGEFLETLDKTAEWVKAEMESGKYISAI